MIDLMSTDQVIDAGLLREELGWTHSTRFAEGMWRMQEWYQRTRLKEDRGDPDTCGGRVLQSA